MQEDATRKIIGIEEATMNLKSGLLVSFPTETVYGLGADANNEHAVLQVFQAKGRPKNHPLIVHLSAITEIEQWATEIPDNAYLLAKHFWPGPLTLVLKKHPRVPSYITGGQDTIALRIPNHPIALELIRKVGSGLVGPSANRYGHISPTKAEHVISDLGNSISGVIDGGLCSVGIESTILLMTEKYPIVMRQGTISIETLSQISQVKIKYPQAKQLATTRVPGNSNSHYAPKTTLLLMPSDKIQPYALELNKDNKSCAILSFAEKPSEIPNNFLWLQMPQTPTLYAKVLYSYLRYADQQVNYAILVEKSPSQTDWAAVNDRLCRAASHIY